MENMSNVPINLVVGGIYKDREGTSVTIVNDQGQKPYIFQSDGTESYTPEGRYDVDELDCSMDLVEIDPVVAALYKVAVNSIQELTGILRPFHDASEQIARRFGNDLPDHQTQFAEVTMGDLRKVSEFFDQTKKDRSIKEDYTALLEKAKIQGHPIETGHQLPKDT